MDLPAFGASLLYCSTLEGWRVAIKYEERLDVVFLQPEYFIEYAFEPLVDVLEYRIHFDYPQ